MALKSKVSQSTLKDNELDASRAVTVGKHKNHYMLSSSSHTLELYEQAEQNYFLFQALELEGIYSLYHVLGRSYFQWMSCIVISAAHLHLYVYIVQ